MPKYTDWIYFGYINLGFMLLISYNLYIYQLNEIKEHWNEYKCIPPYNLLADDIGKNFAECIQGIQLNYMGYLLQPLEHIMDGLGEMSFGMLGDIGNVRGMISYIRTEIGSTIGNVFGVFMNIVIEFQKIMLGVKDIIGKLVGIIVTIMYIMDGGLKTMNSSWNGPPGQMVRAMGAAGACFHPETKIRLKNGNVVQMQNLNLGDILENGSVIRVTMQLDNYKDEPYYKLEKMGVNEEDIYVTGSHFLESGGKFIQVKDYSEAKVSPFLKTKWFSCLITDNHLIQIGKKTFWDWEDDALFYNYTGCYKVV
jgi:hypothetical protein